MTIRQLYSEIKKACEIASKNRHRFGVVLCSSKFNDDFISLAAKVYKKYKDYLTKLNPDWKENLLVVGRSVFLEKAEKYFNGKFVHFKDSQNVLGETYSSLILDLTEGFQPNDLGIVIETIAEGGLILILSPQVDEWKNLIGRWHAEIISEPYDVKDIVPRFYRRFIEKTISADGIIIYNADRFEVVKNYEYEQVGITREEIQIPEKKEIKKKLYKLCATQDQIRVLELFETFFDRQKERKAVVITADRGRGKTAVLGIVTPFLISRMHRVLKRPVRIMVVAPTLQAVQTYFTFLKKSLIRQGMREFRVKESNGMVTVVSNKFARVEYVVPRRAMIEKDYADIIIVDEAAGIDVPVLWKITEGIRYTIFSSTIHGYEGAGRGFSIRFLIRLKEDESVEIQQIHMDEPIRYGKYDPIEKWLNDVLLLDAQPAELNEEDVDAVEKGELKFEYVDKDKLIEDEKLLREFFGIYVLAHYRNRPSDLVILLDMPNHLVFRVSVNNKTVCSLHVAIEGGLDEEAIKKMGEGYKPKGQIIPDLILKHYWDYEFPKFKGVRIVRIATHPLLMNKGIGSFALQKLVEWALKNDLDWAGSGFGVSPELLRFWTKNGFYPVHITPQRNEVSGEYTLIILKPLKMHIHSKIEEINAAFIKRVVEYLNDELRDLEVETAIGLLNSLMKNLEMPKPRYSRVERRRMSKYFQGISLYEYVSDIVRPLVKYYYLNTKKTDLDKIEEEILVSKCLQLKPWWEIEERGFKKFRVLLKAIQKVWRWYDEE